MSTYIGMDAHARTCVFKVKDETGKTIDSDSIPATRDALSLLAEKYPGATVILESSSVHEWIYDFLTELGMNVVACHPQNIRRVLGKKNDEVDAGFLVDAFLLDSLPKSYMPPKDVRELRRLARHRAFLANEKIRLKQRIHAILKRKGVKVFDAKTSDEATDIFLLRLRKELLRVEDPEVPIMLDLIDVFQKRIDAAEKRMISEIDKRPDAKLLTTIPGVGPYVALTLYAEIGDVTRFKTADQMTAYFGLVPSESQSGETTHRGHITRRGNAQVRMLLNQAAWIHMRFCKDGSLAKQHKKLAKKIGHKRALVAAQRKLVKIAFWMLKEKREFKIIG